MAPIPLPGGRDVRGTLDHAAADDETDRSSRPIVVACPPHPQHGGTRRNPLLRAVGDACSARGIDCLRFDYGPWDEGRGERRDAAAAVDWALDRTDRVGLFGYSFGGAIALSVAADRADIAACSAVAPAASLPTGDDSAHALDHIDCPTQVVYGSRDTTVDWQSVVDRAREVGVETVELAADHFFVGHRSRVAAVVADFFERSLR
ncbi:MAG: alpha/beta hydrolase [Halohasta sp.]